MNRLKSIFISLFSMGSMVAAIHSGVKLYELGINSAWLGAFVATAPIAFFFMRLLGIKDVARTSANLPQLLMPAAFGSGLALWLPPAGIWPIVYALGLGAVGSVYYVFFYSRIDRSGAKIKAGDTLPDFTLYKTQGDTQGEPLASNIIRQQPALLLFFRGNWCPLCMAQIKEIAASYKELDKRGVKVYLVSPQTEKQSRSLAKQFDAPMEFMMDKDLQVAKQLGLMHESGTPAGMVGYDSDTVMPTAILTDNNGTVIFADLTDNYRVRPEPQTFINMLDQHGVAS